ncbi:MAG TPA: T9SS type A sorting domain-containing protein [Candidatus Kapabacteria bacterium]|nr:T9SS type A sorting domain-containing protein [Candidatus Kapabacteria bacterium]
MINSKAILISAIVAIGVSIFFQIAYAQTADQAPCFGNPLWLASHSEVYHRVMQLRSLKQKHFPEQPVQSASTQSFVEGDVSNNDATQNETTLAISQSDPKTIVIGANDDSMLVLGMPAYTSFDGGSTWQTIRVPADIPSGAKSFGDPIIVADAHGGFYYSFLVFDTSRLFAITNISDVMVAHSDDGHQWSLCRSVLGKMKLDSGFEDKEIIAIDNDPNSKFFGRVYVEWNHLVNQSIDSATRTVTISGVYPWFSWSDDGGKTWSNPHIADTLLSFFPVIRVGKNGVLFLGGSDAYNRFSLLVSHNGGDTFARYPISDYQEYPLQSNRGFGLKGDTGFRAMAYMSFDVDQKDNTLHVVYGTWDNSLQSAALYYTRSQTEGVSWSTPDRISTAGREYLDHFFPWVCTDPVNGATYASFYSSESDSKNLDVELATATLPQTTTVRAVSTLFDPLSIVDYFGDHFIGDYIGSDACNGTYAVAWTENRPGRQDADIFAYVSSGGSSAVHQVNAPGYSIGNPYPNPVATNTADLEIFSKEDAFASVQLADPSGRIVLRSTVQIHGGEMGKISVDSQHLPNGVYHIVVSISGQLVEKNLVVLH